MGFFENLIFALFGMGSEEEEEYFFEEDEQDGDNRGYDEGTYEEDGDEDDEDA